MTLFQVLVLLFQSGQPAAVTPLQPLKLEFVVCLVLWSLQPEHSMPFTKKAARRWLTRGYSMALPCSLPSAGI